MLKLYDGYECKLDNKGRVLLPTKLKSELAGIIEKGFILKRSIFSQCLELWPKDVWEEKLVEVNKLNRFVKKNADFIRRFLAGVTTIEVDSGGRINLPNHLMAFAGITKSIVITSQLDILELWDKDRYEAKVGFDDEADDFGDLAEEVMGGKPPQNQQ
jgi:MraZ protein